MTAPKISPSEGAEEQGGTACGACTGAVAPERAPSTEHAGAETHAGEARSDGLAGASPSAVDLAAIKDRWAPAFNGFIDLKKVPSGTLQTKLGEALEDIDALIREVGRLRALPRTAREQAAAYVGSGRARTWLAEIAGKMPEIEDVEQPRASVREFDLGPYELIDALESSPFPYVVVRLPGDATYRLEVNHKGLDAAREMLRGGTPLVQMVLREVPRG